MFKVTRVTLLSSCPAAVVNSVRDGDCGSCVTAMDKGAGLHQLAVLSEVSRASCSRAIVQTWADLHQSTSQTQLQVVAKT